MKKLNIILIIVLSFWVFIFSCTNDKLPPLIECENGYEWINNNCHCPSNKFEAYEFCRELSEMEWYGITENCQCIDTLFFKIEGIDNDNKADIQLNNDIFRNYGQSGGWLQKRFKLTYFTMVDGDSLASHGLPFGELSCNIDDHIAPEYSINMYGKFTPNMDTLNMKFTYRTLPGYDYVETCDVLFHK